MSTIYDKTDNYGLNLYGDKDPADLRDGYNDSMHTIDETLKNHLDKIDGVSHTVTDAVQKQDAKIALKADRTYVDEQDRTLQAAIDEQDRNLQTAIDGKADRTYVDGMLEGKADSALVYSKHDVDSTFALKADTYTKEEVDRMQAGQDEAINALNRGVDQDHSVLVSYFLSQSERLHYAVSSDGVNFGHPYIRDNDEGETVRDPSCVYVDGQVYFCWTRPTEAGGGAFGKTDTIGIAQLNPTTGDIVRRIITPGVPGTSNLWAPDFYLEDSTLHIIFSVKTATQDFQPYEIHSTGNYADPSSWSTPVALGIAPYGGIDHHIIKDDAGTYHDLSADGSVISERHSRTLIGGWSGRTTVDKNWRYLEAPASYRLANGRWRVFFDGGGLQGDYNPGSNLRENDGLMFYCDFSNDLSTHGPLHPVPTAMRHCGLTLIPNDYLATQARLEVGSGIGGAYLYNSVDIPVGLDSAGKNVRALFNRFEGFGGLQNTGFGGSHNTTEGFIVGNSGLYVLAASVSYKCTAPKTWINAQITCYPQRDFKNARNLGIGAQGFSAPDDDTITTVVLPATLVYLHANDQIQIKMFGRDGAVTQRANNSYFTAFKVA
jgi:hypothetical protein